MAAMILRRRHADATVAARPDADVPDRRPGVFSGSTPMEAILMRIRFPAFIPAAALALSAFAPTLPAATFSVGPGATCTHNSLQAALDSAANNSGADVVRVVRTATWTSIQVSTDTGQDVEIVGGWEACTSAAPSGMTTLDGAGGQARSVIALRGNANFTLRNLEITGGDQAGDDDG